MFRVLGPVPRIGDSSWKARCVRIAGSRASKLHKARREDSKPHDMVG
jgi:hypothetical protein